MTPVVIMCGGRGLRLHPLTEKTPKPLLRVGTHPILETIVTGFAEQGFKRLWLAVNYHADLIEGYFGNGQGRGVKIRYLHEREPLGTAGALALLPGFDVPFIVSNADVLTKVSYGHLMEAHARSGALATVCTALHQQQIPYGVVSNGDAGFNIREKPIENFQVNAGIYVIEPEALEQLPKGRFDMPELLLSLEKVNIFPIEDFWYDIGGFEEYARANAEWNV